MFDIESINYSYPLSIQDLNLIENFDLEVSKSLCLFSILNRINGVSDVDYCSMFIKTAILFSIDKEFDNDETQAKIKETIDFFLSLIKEYNSNLKDDEIKAIVHSVSSAFIE